MSDEVWSLDVKNRFRGSLERTMKEKENRTRRKNEEEEEPEKK